MHMHYSATSLHPCMQVPELSPGDCREFLHKTLAFKNRRLTEGQEQLAMASFLHCPLPLYNQLLTIELVTWKSYSEVKWDQDPPPKSLSGNFLILHEVCHVCPACITVTNDCSMA